MRNRNFYMKPLNDFKSTRVVKSQKSIAPSVSNGRKGHHWNHSILASLSFNAIMHRRKKKNFLKMFFQYIVSQEYF